MSSAAKRQRQPTETRRKAIVDAAREVFLEHGYSCASVDEVVERAGGSKATVYAMFGNKQGLFSALVASCADDLSHLVDTLPSTDEKSFEQSLHQFCRRYLEIVLSPGRIALYRLVIGESGRFPEIGDIFYSEGPQMVVKSVAEFFRTAARNGQIVSADPERLASYFLDTLRSNLHMRVLLNPTRVPTAREIESHIDFIIPMFLRSAKPRK